MGLVGWDIDGVLTKTAYNAKPGDVVISGRLFAQYDSLAKRLARICPVYIRGVGERTDWRGNAEFKIMMIRHLGVTRYTESEPRQAVLIRKGCPKVVVIVPEESKASAEHPAAWTL